MKCEKCGLNDYNLDAIRLFGNVSTTLCRLCNRIWDALVREDKRWDEVHELCALREYYDLQSVGGSAPSLEELQELSARARDVKNHFRTKALAFLGENDVG